MVKVIVVNGAPGSGKTTFEHFCDLEMRYECRIESTINPVKEAAKLLGWDGEKTPDTRKFLSDLKDMATRYFDMSFNYVKSIVEDIERLQDVYDVKDAATTVLFVDSREPEEIARFVKEFNAMTLLVRREGADSIISNHADAEVENYTYDYVINNDGDLDDLRRKARAFVYLIQNS